MEVLIEGADFNAARAWHIFLSGPYIILPWCVRQSQDGQEIELVHSQ